MLTSSDLVVLTNESEKHLSFRWDGKVYGAPPGASVHLPFDVVRKEFGDPRSAAAARTIISEDGRERIHVPSRASELARLSQWHGLSVRQQTDNPSLTLNDVVPRVSVTTVDGASVPTVVDDPEGDAPLPMPVDLDSPEAVAAQVAQHKRDLEQLQSKLDELLAAAASGAPGEGDDTKEDGPGNRPRGAQPGAGRAQARNVP